MSFSVGAKLILTERVTAPPFSRRLRRVISLNLSSSNVSIHTCSVSGQQEEGGFFFFFFPRYWLSCLSCSLRLPMKTVAQIAAWGGTCMERHTGMPELMRTYLFSSRLTGTSIPFCPIAGKGRDMNMVSTAKRKKLIVCRGSGTF